jgi:hypothetical protein
MPESLLRKTVQENSLFVEQAGKPVHKNSINEAKSNLSNYKIL